MSDEQQFLKRATELGNKKAEPYNFGAVVVLGGKIIGEGFNQTHEQSDPSAHGEILALRAAGLKLGKQNLDGAILYCSHEPCLMCFMCAAYANVSRVVYAVAAQDQPLRYELKHLTLGDIAKQLQGRDISIEHKNVSAS